MPVRLMLAVLVLALLPMAADGASFIVRGMEFSDERGGFRLLAASGSGSRADPFVLVEEIFGPGPAVLVIRGLDRLAGGNRGETRPIAIRLRKQVRNLTADVWGHFDLELRQHPAEPSDYFDGLSFDQAATSTDPFASDRFRIIEPIMEPSDFLRFSGGEVRPGATASFDLVITDTSPGPLFYLIQLPKTPMVEGPKPDTSFSQVALE